MTREEFIKQWPQASESTIAANCSDGVASSSIAKRGPSNESVAATPGENPRPAKCIVRITSCRSRLIDERNLHDKAFVDALKMSGAIFDDSPKWCKVEVSQIAVAAGLDRTIIEIKYPE